MFWWWSLGYNRRSGGATNSRAPRGRSAYAVSSPASALSQSTWRFTHVFVRPSRAWSAGSSRACARQQKAQTHFGAAQGAAAPTAAATASSGGMSLRSR